MLRKVSSGLRQEAERRTCRRPPVSEAASAPPPNGPRVCIMSIDRGGVNRASRAGRPGATRRRVASHFRSSMAKPRKRPVRQEPSRESGFNLRTWRQRRARARGIAGKRRKPRTCIQGAVHARDLVARRSAARLHIGQRRPPTSCVLRGSLRSHLRMRAVGGLRLRMTTVERLYSAPPHHRSLTVSIATKVEVCATWGSAEIRSPSTRR